MPGSETMSVREPYSVFQSGVADSARRVNAKDAKKQRQPGYLCVLRVLHVDSALLHENENGSGSGARSPSRVSARSPHTIRVRSSKSKGRKWNQKSILIPNRYTRG